MHSGGSHTPSGSLWGAGLQPPDCAHSHGSYHVPSISRKAELQRKQTPTPGLGLQPQRLVTQSTRVLLPNQQEGHAEKGKLERRKAANRVLIVEESDVEPPVGFRSAEGRVLWNPGKTQGLARVSHQNPNRHSTRRQEEVRGSCTTRKARKKQLMNGISEAENRGKVEEPGRLGDKVFQKEQSTSCQM